MLSGTLLSVASRRVAVTMISPLSGAEAEGRAGPSWASSGAGAIVAPDSSNIDTAPCESSTCHARIPLCYAGRCTAWQRPAVTGLHPPDRAGWHLYVFERTRKFRGTIQFAQAGCPSSDRSCRRVSTTSTNKPPSSSAMTKATSSSAPAPSRAAFTTTELGGDAWLFLEETNQALAQHCHVPPGMVSFLFLLGPDCWVRLERGDFGPGDLAVLPGSSHFAVSCPADTAFCVITLEERRLARTIGLAPDAGASGIYRLESRHMASTVGALRSLVLTFLSMIAASDSEFDDAFAQMHLKEALLSTLALAVTTGSQQRQTLPAPLYFEARALIDAELAEVNVTRLCSALEVSRRTLEDVFRRQVGIGPARFIKTLRLNQVRRELKRAGGVAGSVGDIAARWGLWHPSHFSSDYASFFGELPSMSKRRMRSPEDNIGTRLIACSKIPQILSRPAPAKL